MADLRLRLTLTALDRISAPLRAINNRIEALQAPATRLGGELSRAFRVSGLGKLSQGLSGVGREVVGLTGKMAALAGVGGYLFKSQFIDTAAEFEKYSAILKTLEGSSQKAEQSLAWVSDFATTTPFTFAEVTESFVRLRSYGIDPMNGSLRTLGDASAALGKPLSQAVEAIADAVTGENERLKEFGITTSVQGNRITYSYQEAGKTINKTADKRNKAMIQSTLYAIWNSKYAGAMANLSKTWIGLTSNLEDQWTRVKLAVLKGGLFDYLKGKLANLLALVDRMAADGSLQKWAAEVGNKLQKGFEAAFAAGNQLYQFVGQLADRVGGFGNLAKISLGVVAAIMAGPLLLAVTQVVQGVLVLATAFAANPMLLAITAVIAAVVLLYKNWDNVVSGIKLAIDDIAGWFNGIFMAAINNVKGAISGIKDGIVGIVRGLNPFADTTPLFPYPQPSQPAFSGVAPPGTLNGFRPPVKSPVLGPSAQLLNSGSTNAAPKPIDCKLLVEFTGAPVTVKKADIKSGTVETSNPRAGRHF